jgi:3-phenylpropionate/trans-cinnamate dioxygenase ferredoxin component
MDNYFRVGVFTDFPLGTIKTVRHNGKNVAIANVDGELFAIDDNCSHEDCSLGTEGAMDGNVVICGCHGSSFDVTNGKVMSLPAPTDILTYEVKQENGEVWIKI